jgi:hypothetical protein
MRTVRAGGPEEGRVAMIRKGMLGLSLAALLAACGTTAPPAVETHDKPLTFYTAAEYAAAVRSAQNSYRWPADRHPDIERVIRDSSPPEGARAQAGLEKTVLSIVNACAWYLSWNDAVAAGRAQQAADALNVIAGELPQREEDPSTRQLALDIAARAKAGDTKPAMDYAQANCDNVTWLPA